MKSWRLTAAWLVAVSFMGSSVWSRPVDLSAPSGEVGAANAKGYLEIWREMDDAGIDFGKGSYLPLRYKFSTDPAIGGILGPGFYLPMFEARNALIREGTMRAYLPCGKGLYLWQDTVDPTKFKTPDKEWTGALSTNNDFTVWRDDGWTVVYHQGRLTSITTDEKRVFTWDYDSNTHMAAGISENGKSLVTVEPNQQGLVDAVVFDGKRYEIGYAERPLIEMLQGQPVIKQLAIALSSFKYPDGKAEGFHFELTPKRVPTMTFTDPDKKQTVYTWDAASHHIATEKGPDGNWTYEIGDIAGPFDSPPISRTSSDGKTEAMTVDKTMGTYTAQAANGITTVTHVFEAPGPLYHKVKSVEKTTNGVTVTTFKASYDEAGRLIREVDSKGFTTTFLFASSGQSVKRVISPPSDPNTLREVSQREKELLDLISHSLTSQDKSQNIEQLAYVYIDRLGDYSRALALIPQVSDEGVACVIQEMAICRNDTLSPTQKVEQLKPLLSKYPNRKSEVQNLISQYEYGATHNL